MAVEKLRVLVVEDSVLMARVLREMVDSQPDMTVVDVATTGQDAVRRAGDLRPDIILMDIHLPDIDGVHATWLIASKNPESSVIMVTSEERTEFMQRAMVAGAQGYVLKPVRDASEMANTIRTVRQRAQERRSLLVAGAAAAAPVAPAGAPALPPPLGRRVALFSPKGGQGTTTIAVNLAVTLRVLTDKPVLLVDADLRFGDTNILLDLPFQRSILDLVPHIDQLDSALLDQVLATHASGLKLLMRPERPELAETITAEHISKVLTILPRLFDYIVIDCEVSYDETLLAVLDHADQILIVLNPELGSLRNAKHFLQLADTLGYARSKISFIINRSNSNVGLSPGDVERSLGGGHFFRMDSYGRQLTTDLNMGQPSVLAHPKSDFTRIMREVAESIRDGVTSAR
jgi:pilus assembly protein CpaE